MRDMFTDHSANERTFLAWVRTALAIVGFGILASKMNGQQVAGGGIGFTGLLLLVFGMGLVVAAGARFLLLRKRITDGHPESGSPVLLDITLMATVVLLIATLAGFGTHLIIAD